MQIVYINQGQIFWGMAQMASFIHIYNLHYVW